MALMVHCLLQNDTLAIQVHSESREIRDGSKQIFLIFPAHLEQTNLKLDFMIALQKIIQYAIFNVLKIMMIAVLTRNDYLPLHSSLINSEVGE